MHHTPHDFRRATRPGKPSQSGRRARSIRRTTRRVPIAFVPDDPGKSIDGPGTGRLESHRADPVAGDTAGSAQPAMPRGATPQPGLRVLLAEDDPMVARSTVAVLRRLGHSVTHVLDGSSAWKSLQTQMSAFDVLLLDVVMPRMSGSDLAYRARSAGFTGPIVLISGLVTRIDPDALALLGIRKFLTKPFMPADLDRALRGLD